MRRVIKAGESDQCTGAGAAVLNLSDFAAEARRIVLDARKDSSRIVSEARAKSDSVRRQARQQGYAEGFARGQADGHADGRQQASVEAGRTFASQYADVLGLVRKIVANLADARGGMLHDSAGQILDLAVLLAEKIVTTVAAENIDAARANLAKVLDMTHCGGQIVVHVNPSQLDSLQSHFSDLAEALGHDGAVRLTGDKRISPGGVVLSTRNGRIDATIETQLANIAQALLGRSVRRAEQQAADDEPQQMGHYEPVASEATEAPATDDCAERAVETNHEDA